MYFKQNEMIGAKKYYSFLRHYTVRFLKANFLKKNYVFISDLHRVSAEGCQGPKFLGQQLCSFGQLHSGRPVPLTLMSSTILLERCGRRGLQNSPQQCSSLEAFHHGMQSRTTCRRTTSLSPEGPSGAVWNQ